MDDRIVTKKPGGRSADRTRDSERTKADILTVATKEFANHGLTGARIDTIAALMRTSKRMIYYYFGSKEGLYLAVLEKAYSHIRAAEASLPLELPRCRGGLATACEQTFENDAANEDFVRLVAIENIHLGRLFEKTNSLGRSTRAPSRRSNQYSMEDRPPECSETTSIRSMFIWRSARFVSFDSPINTHSERSLISTSPARAGGENARK